MLTHEIMTGVANAPLGLAVFRPSPDGGFVPAAGTFDDAPSLRCDVWPGDDRSVVATLPASWADAPNAIVRVDFPPAVVDPLPPGWCRAVVLIEATDEALAECGLKISSGPGSAAARPVYCSHRDLADELPWIADLASDTEDQSGFHEARAAAREWIDGLLVAAIPAAGGGLRSWQWGWSWGDDSGLRDRYSAALAANELDVESPDGRRIVRAATYRSLATILRRAVGGAAGAGRDLLATAAAYSAMADAEAVQVVARFPAAALPPLYPGVARSRRR